MARKTVYNQLTSPEKWNMVSKENKDLLIEFEQYLKSTDKSPGTIFSYDNDIKIFFIWNLQNNNNKFFIDFNKRDVIKYQNYLINELNLSSNRVRRLKAAISSMSNFIESVLDDDFPKFRNIINKIPAPVKQEVREKTVLSEDQVQKLLDYLVENKKYQQACVFALALASGARKSELLRFKIDFFKDEFIIYNALYKTPEKIKTKGRTSKGKLLNKYVLVGKFKKYFDLWMQERKELGIKSEELFIVKKQDTWVKMDISTLNSWSITFSNVLGVDFYWHSLRHYFCTELCKANIPADIIKDINGWDGVEMLCIYNDSQIDDELGKYFGEEGIKTAKIKGFGDL